MYAIIESGGKQRRVTPGALVTLERIEGEAGSQVELSKVLLVADGEQVKVGNPYLQGATVIERDRPAGTRAQDHRLQVQTAQTISTQAGPPSGADDRANHGDQGLGQDVHGS